MRLWSIHPSYLDAKGLVACWREGLLARKVLSGKTIGYTNHPQLNRFKKYKNKISLIDSYLYEIYNEARVRGYSFDKSKIGNARFKKKIRVTSGQIEFELEHLKHKLQKRCPSQLENNAKIKTKIIHPLFRLVEGEIEEWEK